MAGPSAATTSCAARAELLLHAAQRFHGDARERAAPARVHRGDDALLAYRPAEWARSRRSAPRAARRPARDGGVAGADGEPAREGGAQTTCATSECTWRSVASGIFAAPRAASSLLAIRGDGGGRVPLGQADARAEAVHQPGKFLQHFGLEKLRALGASRLPTGFAQSARTQKPGAPVGAGRTSSRRRAAARGRRAGARNAPGRATSGRCRGSPTRRGTGTARWRNFRSGWRRQWSAAK